MHIPHFFSIATTSCTLDEGSAYVVSECWLVRKLEQVVSYWPPYKQKQQVLNAILEKEQITLTWSNHPVKILHSYIRLAIFFLIERIIEMIVSHAATLQHASDHLVAAAWAPNLDWRTGCGPKTGKGEEACWPYGQRLFGRCLKRKCVSRYKAVHYKLLFNVNQNLHE